MEIVRFGSLYKIPTSNGVSRPSAVRGQGFHMINMGELFAHDIINEMPMDRVALSENEQSKFLVEKGDLLFARQSLVAAGAGKCSIVNDIIEPTTFESHLIRVRLDEKLCCSRYFFYLFQLPNNPIKAIVNQCAQAGIRGSELQKIKVPLPSLKVQRRIASILSAYDNLIENNNNRIRLLEQMAENLYKEWFVRFRFPGHEKVEMENGLPKGWKYERLDAIASINMGQSPPSSFYNEEQKGLPFHQGVGSYGGIYLKDEIYSTQGAKVAESNSIIFSVRAPVGRINITLNKIYLGRGVAAINSLNGNNGFLYWSLRSKFAKEDTIGNGAIFSSVTRDELGRQKMLVPDKSTVAKFESLSNEMENLIRGIYKQNKSLTRQRDLLLPRLMSGKLEVKE